MEVLETDMELIVAHRQEAGAPEPPPLEDVPMPVLPGATVAKRAQRTPVPPPLTLKSGGGGTGSTRDARPFLAWKPSPSSNVMAAVGEVRQVAAFVSKWNLDSVRTKSLLSRLSAGKRRLIMETFKPSASNLTATSALERFIVESEREPVSKPTSSVANLGAKRTREDVSAGEANKRPRNGTIRASSPRRSPANAPQPPSIPPPSHLSHVPPRTPKPPSTPPPSTTPGITRKVSTPSSSKVSVHSNGDAAEERTPRRSVLPTVPPKKVFSSEPPSLKKTSEAGKPGDLIKNLLG